MPLPSALVTAIGSIDYRQNNLQSQAAGSSKNKLWLKQANQLLPDKGYNLQHVLIATKGMKITHD